MMDGNPIVPPQGSDGQGPEHIGRILERMVWDTNLTPEARATIARAVGQRHEEAA